MLTLVIVLSAFCAAAALWIVMLVRTNRQLAQANRELVGELSNGTKLLHDAAGSMESASARLSDARNALRSSTASLADANARLQSIRGELRHGRQARESFFFRKKADEDWLN